MDIDENCEIWKGTKKENGFICTFFISEFIDFFKGNQIFSFILWMMYFYIKNWNVDKFKKIKWSEKNRNMINFCLFRTNNTIL